MIITILLLKLLVAFGMIGLCFYHYYKLKTYTHTHHPDDDFNHLARMDKQTMKDIKEYL